MKWSELQSGAGSVVDCLKQLYQNLIGSVLGALQ